MKNWLKENWFKIGILLAVLIVAVSFSYNLVLLPNFRDKAKQADQNLKNSQDKKARSDASASRDLCLGSAQDNFNNTFQINSVAGKGDTRWWNTLEIQKLSETKLQNDRDECFKKYPTN